MSSRKLAVFLLLVILLGAGGFYLFSHTTKKKTEGTNILSEQVTSGTLLLAPFDGFVNLSEKLESGHFLVFRSIDATILLEITFPAEEVFEKKDVVAKGELLARLGEGTLEVKVAKGNFEIALEDLLLKVGSQP